MTTKKTKIAATMRPSSQAIEDADGYADFAERLRMHFATLAGPLFLTNATGLFETFLYYLPPARRAHYNCRCCRHFIEAFGGLVSITEDGSARSIWKIGATGIFGDALAALDEAVMSAKVTGVFLSKDHILGTVNTVSRAGVCWKHVHVLQQKPFTHPLLAAGQMMAEKVQDHHMLDRALGEYGGHAREAHRLLTAGGLYRSEKCIGVAEWFLRLRKATDIKNRRLRENIMWHAVATAPPGFCHIRSTMIGTLLQDIKDGKSYDAIKRAFDEKMSPISYQRPQAAPSDGQLKAAEAAIAKLASAGSLNRRYATMDDLRDAPKIWTPREERVLHVNGGVVDHLCADRRPPTSAAIGTQTMTWEKFARTVLPSAEKVELVIRHHDHTSYFAFVTAADMSAPPILQWDREEARQPVSNYVYVNGSPAYRWGLTGTTAEVLCITPDPARWRGAGMAHHGEGAYLLLKGARDQGAPGLALFPEILRSEYHGIRAAIEAYSNSKRLPECENPAAGICIRKGQTWQTLRVTANGGTALYLVDRWD